MLPLSILTIILQQKNSILTVSTADGENEVQEDNNILQGTVLSGGEGNQAKILSRSPTHVHSCDPNTRCAFTSQVLVSV